MKEIERVKRHWDGLPNTMMEDLVNLFEALDKRITSLRDDVNENASRIEEWADSTDIQINALESCRTDLARQLSDIECRQDIVECGHGKPTTPPSRCEGCADFPCGRASDFIPRTYPSREPACHREKKACGECKHPCWSVEVPAHGVCFWHTLAMKLQRKGLGKRNYPEPVRVDDDACPNFEAREA